MVRRNFLKTTSLATGALLAPHAIFPAVWEEQKLQKIGVQVYTVREDLQNDFAGTIKKVAGIGYDYLELFNYNEHKIYDKSIKELNIIFSDNNIEAKSLHVLTGAQAPEQEATMMKNWEKVVADAAEMALDYLVCAYLVESERQTIDDYKRLAALFNKSAEVCQQYGIQFCYHNHDFEFKPLGTTVPYDILLAEADKDLVKMQLDLYWITKAGQEPIKYFKAHPGRFPLWHVKDMSIGKQAGFTEVGNGRIDWQSIFQHTGASGMKKFFVEQDVCKDYSALESLNISYNYLKNLEF